MRPLRIILDFMKTSAEIVDEMGGSTALGEALGVPVTTVSSWRTRKWIPIKYWPAVIRLAKAQGVKGVTTESLTKLAFAAQSKLEKCA